MKNKKNFIVAIAVIMAIVATAMFLVVKVTALFIAAYVIALIGISAFCFGNLYLLSSMKSYPWFVAFPITIWKYLTVQIALSVIFIAIENIFKWSMPINWFVFLHILLLAPFLIVLILQKGGKDIIEQLGERVREKYIDFRSIQLDIESVKERFPAKSKEIQQVIDALRYSLPMSHPSIAPYEDKIKDSVVMLEQAAEANNSERISELCVTLLRQIKDRNNRAKLVK